MFIREKTVETGAWLVSEETRLYRLVIRPGATLSAPEGKTLTLSVDGEGRAVKPGTYQGDVCVSLADCHPVPFNRFPEPHQFRMAVCIEDGKLNRGKSVLELVKGGELDDRHIKGASITTTDDAFNGIYVTGDGEFLIEDCELDFCGDGGNDFIGFGAGVCTHGRAKLTMNNTKLTSRGVARNTAFVGDDSEAVFNNCEFSTRSDGVLPPDYVECMALGTMKRVPWLMGMRGTCRCTNLAERATVHYNNCVIRSNSWGVLSVDSSDVVRMFVKDSLVELTGRSGYGAFSIGDSWDEFDHSTVRVPTYALVMSTENAGGEFKNGCLVESGRFGANIFRNEGKLKINSGSVFNTKEACILVRGSNTYIEVDDAVLNPANGRILQVMDNDDNGSVPTPFIPPIGETDVYEEGRDLTVSDPRMDVFASFSNMELKGGIYNSTTNLRACCRNVPANPFAGEQPEGELPHEGPVWRGMSPDLQGAKNLDIKLENVKLEGVVTAAEQAYADGVTEIYYYNPEELGNVSLTPAAPINNGVILSLDKGSVWTVTGSCWLTSLTVAVGSAVKAPAGKTLRATLNGQPAELGEGSWKGSIVLTVE